MWDAVGAIGAVMMGLGSMGISIHTKVKTNARLRAVERPKATGGIIRDPGWTIVGERGPEIS